MPWWTQLEGVISRSSSCVGSGGATDFDEVVREAARRGSSGAPLCKEWTFYLETVEGRCF